MIMPKYLQEYEEDVLSLRNVVRSIQEQASPSEVADGIIQLKADMEQFMKDVTQMTEDQFFTAIDSIKETFFGLHLLLSSSTNASV